MVSFSLTRAARLSRGDSSLSDDCADEKWSRRATFQDELRARPVSGFRRAAVIALCSLRKFDRGGRVRSSRVISPRVRRRRRGGVARTSGPVPVDASSSPRVAKTRYRTTPLIIMGAHFFEHQQQPRVTAIDAWTLRFALLNRFHSIQRTAYCGRPVFLIETSQNSFIL